MASVHSLHLSAGHQFSKNKVAQFNLLAGFGVEGDTHGGATVQHRSRVAKDPSQPNLRQVHLVELELLEELAVDPGALGENITTTGISLHQLPRGTRIRFGSAEIEITGLRNPCQQIEDYRAGLLSRVVGKNEHGEVIRRAGIMAVVVKGGVVNQGEGLEITEPDKKLPLEVV